MNKAQLSGRRERAVIAKENNFAQPGQRFRSWDNARQERFLGRMADILLDKRCTQVRRRLGFTGRVGFRWGAWQTSCCCCWTSAAHR
jgi:hypothetical protein